jgi:purine nucleosidase
MARVICDNDWSGDPDGLFQLAQHVLSPSIDIPLIVGSNLPLDMPWAKTKTPASEARDKALELLAVMGRAGNYRVLAGSETAIPKRSDVRPSPATAAIIEEALRQDARGPLVYAAGAGLTELARAWLANPAIGRRLKLIWIGGSEHKGLALPPPNPDPLEFNFGLDPLAAQIVFNESDIEIWQVPRNVYRQMLVSYAELAELAQTGPLGRYLADQVKAIGAMVEKVLPNVIFPRSETYVLGDSPLVTLTALQSFFQPDPTSSSYVLLPTPKLGADGGYTDNPSGRPMRVYTQIDTRLTFADMAAKIRAADVALRRKGKPA